LEQYHNLDHKVAATMKRRHMSDKKQKKELAQLAEEEEVNVNEACVDLGRCGSEPWQQRSNGTMRLF
jgi:hypothetical protein